MTNAIVFLFGFSKYIVWTRGTVKKRMMSGSFGLLESCPATTALWMKSHPHIQSLAVGVQRRLFRKWHQHIFACCRNSFTRSKLPTASTDCLPGWWLVLKSQPGNDTDTQRHLICMLDLQHICVCELGWEEDRCCTCAQGLSDTKYYARYESEGFLQISIRGSV